MRKNTKKVAFLVACLVFLITGCFGNSKVGERKDSDKINVYASFYTMYDFANKIGGDRINLVNIMPAGTEPHHWNRHRKIFLRLRKLTCYI